MSRDSEMLNNDYVDNGAGLDTDARAVIFEKFSRVAGQDGDGAGLGLAICREVMVRLGGGIEYLPVQTGTGFRVRLPSQAVVPVDEKEQVSGGVSAGS